MLWFHVDPFYQEFLLKTIVLVQTKNITERQKIENDTSQFKMMTMAVKAKIMQTEADSQ